CQFCGAAAPLVREADAVGGERPPTVEAPAPAQHEPPRRVVDRLPGLGERRDELVVVGHVEQRIVDVPEHRRAGDRIMVRGIEGQHPLGQAGDDLAAARLGAGGARTRGRGGEGGTGAEDELPAAQTCFHEFLLPGDGHYPISEWHRAGSGPRCWSWPSPPQCSPSSSATSRYVRRPPRCASTAAISPSRVTSGCSWPPSASS